MNEIPKSIELLFINFNLSAIKFLFISYYTKGRKSTLKLEEYLYYELLYSNYNSSECDSKTMRYSFYKISKELPSIIIYLENSGYIKIEKTNISKILDMNISFLEKGKRLILDLKEPYFEELKENIIKLKSDYKYTKGGYKNILEKMNE